MLNIVRFWILLSAFLSAAGWILSAFHQLNRGGYLIFFAFAALALVLGWRRLNFRRPLTNITHRAWHKLWRRFKRPAPMFFLALALMGLAAGVLYAPDNIDSNAYRIPRVLHWLASEKWHWIHTSDARMNSAGCGFEWLSAPLVLFTRTDRFLFLINWLSYLMLPGLIFSVLTRLGVRARVAWWWMWALASGWCFVLQAGSTGNDSFGAIYALAAVDLALRAQERKNSGDLWLSMLAAALLTNAKQTNIPLVLLWLIAVLPGARLFLKRPLVTVAMITISLLVSAVPITLFNFKYSGNWIGISHSAVNHLQNPIWAHSTPDSFLWGVIGNVFCVPAQNLVLPYFPWAEKWNAAMEKFLQTPLGAHFISFEHFGLLSRYADEYAAGLGVAICLFTLISICLTRRYQQTSAPEPAVKDRFLWLLRMTPWMLLLLFMAKVGTMGSARLLAPYYPFLFPMLLAAPGHAHLVRRVWWQYLGLLTMFFAALLLISLQDRPLFPAQTILVQLREKYPHSKFVSKVSHFYAAGTLVFDNGNPFAKDLPSDQHIIGYATAGGMSEPLLWLPFGQWRVERVLEDDTSKQLQELGIRYVVVEDLALEATHQTIEQWMDRHNAVLVAQTTYRQQASQGSFHLYLVRLLSEKVVLYD